MERRAAKKSMLCFANYLAEWADWYDNLGYTEIADGITHVAMQLAREAGQIQTDPEGQPEPNERKSSTSD